jgi:hypothetical protein
MIEESRASGILNARMLEVAGDAGAPMIQGAHPTLHL